MARFDQAKVRRTAIFIKEWRAGKDFYTRRPYDVVEYNWGDGPPDVYLQPHMGRPMSRTEDEEAYDDVRFYSTPPEWDLMAPARR
jgi:hypothetical protein